MRTIHILNGPNLNLLGTREPEIYGHDTLAAIEQACRTYLDRTYLEKHKVALTFAQTNSEGGLIDLVQAAAKDATALVINPAGYGHTSVALHDALKAAAVFKIELHLSNPHAREDFRHTSLVSPVVNGTICGFGSLGYRLAIDAALSHFDSHQA